MHPIWLMAQLPTSDYFITKLSYQCRRLSNSIQKYQLYFNLKPLKTTFKIEHTSLTAVTLHFLHKRKNMRNWRTARKNYCFHLFHSTRLTLHFDPIYTTLSLPSISLLFYLLLGSDGTTEHIHMLILRLEGPRIRFGDFDCVFKFCFIFRFFFWK